MTEFEAATLALQQSQFWAAIALPLVAALVGAGQILVVLHGIRVMDRANEDRARQMEAQRREADQREKRADQRHTEAMRALEALVKGMDQQAEALKVVIERTAPPPRETP